MRTTARRNTAAGLTGITWPLTGIQRTAKTTAVTP